MSIRSEAEENLRVIRSLMEKATVYRAISAPGALVGGLLASSVAAFSLQKPHAVLPFVSLWFLVLAVTAAVNFLLLRRDAARRGEPFISPGMRLALRAMIPALAGGGLATFIDGGPALIASLWVLSYGISLLAASHFAPKSICWLGRAFFCAGACLLGARGMGLFTPEVDSLRTAHLIMGSTFGAFHLIYAAATWPRLSASSVGQP